MEYIIHVHIYPCIIMNFKILHILYWSLQVIIERHPYCIIYTVKFLQIMEELTCKVDVLDEQMDTWTLQFLYFTCMFIPLTLFYTSSYRSLKRTITLLLLKMAGYENNL